MNPPRNLDGESELAVDPKPDWYTGDIKGLIVSVIEEHREELGLTIPHQQIIDIVEHGVSSRISELVRFNDRIETTYREEG